MTPRWPAASATGILARASLSLVISFAIAAAMPTLSGAATVTSATVDLAVQPGGSVTASWVSVFQGSERRVFSAAANGVTTNAVFTANGGTGVSVSESPDTGYLFTGWSGSVSGTNASSSFSVTANHTYSVTAAFGPASIYSMTFIESGLTGPRQWSVDLNGSTTSSSGTSITFANLSNGTYPYSINPPSGYAASPPSGSVLVKDGSQPIRVSFALSDEQEAVASYQALQANLYLPSVQLYQGLPSSSCDPYSCLWPFTNAMAGTEYLDASPGGSSYAPDVAARLNGLLAYVDPHEVSPNGAAQPRAFESAVTPPEGPGGNTYYDDNAWSALDLIDAYRLTGNPIDLTLAQDTFNFVLTGWDTSQTDGCPGGVFWEDVSGSQRNTTANAGNAEVGLELYQLTNDSSDLSWAEQMYQWVNTCLESPSGLYYDHVNSDGSVDTTMWSYNQGTMIGAGALLDQITGNLSYLTAAQRTAAAAVSYFGTGTTLQDQGPAFNAIYFRDLFVLGQIQPNTTYTAEAQAYATYMWTQRDTSSGLFFQNGQTNGVNGTAPMVETYSLLAGSTPRP